MQPASGFFITDNTDEFGFHGSDPSVLIHEIRGARKRSGAAALAFAAGFVFVFLALAWAMWRKKWFVKV